MIAFSIWNFHVYWYWIFYLVWFLLTYFFLKWIWKKKFFEKFDWLQKILNFWLEDLLIALILWVIIGGRLWEVFIYQWSYFSQHLWEIFAIWNWWMSFIWWLVGVIISLLIFVKIKKIKLKELSLLCCLLVVVVPIAIALWRFWNYLNQELYWIVIPNLFINNHSGLSHFLTKINIFHVYPHIDSELRLNTNWLAIIFEWIIPFVVWIIIFSRQMKKKNVNPNINIWMFLFLYSIARFVLEYFRFWSQTQFVWIFTKSQWIFILFFIVAVVMLLNSRNKNIEL